MLTPELIKRLEVITRLVSLEEFDMVELQVDKLRDQDGQEEVQPILDALSDNSYGTATRLIQELITPASSVATYEDPEVVGLKVEAKKDLADHKVRMVAVYLTVGGSWLALQYSSDDEWMWLCYIFLAVFGVVAYSAARWHIAGSPDFEDDDQWGGRGDEKLEWSNKQFAILLILGFATFVVVANWGFEWFLPMVMILLLFTNEK